MNVACSIYAMVAWVASIYGCGAACAKEVASRSLLLVLNYCLLHIGCCGKEIELTFLHYFIIGSPVKSSFFCQTETTKTIGT